MWYNPLWYNPHRLSKHQSLSTTVLFTVSMCMSRFNFILGLNFIHLCFQLIIVHYNTPKQRKINLNQGWTRTCACNTYLLSVNINSWEPAAKAWVRVIPTNHHFWPKKQTNTNVYSCTTQNLLQSITESPASQTYLTLFSDFWEAAPIFLFWPQMDSTNYRKGISNLLSSWLANWQ